jgi:hypothetical protein
MSTSKVNRFTPLPIFSLLISGCWVLMSESIPVQAQIPDNTLFLAQVTVPIYEIPTNQQPIQPVEFNNQNYHLSQTREYNQFDKYFVYVDNSNSQTLQRVRQIERDAYIRNYQGRKVIQVGVFNGQSNAQRRVKELEYYGIRGAGIGNSGNPNVELRPDIYNQQASSYVTPGYNISNNTNTYPQEKRNSYYIVIPSNSNNLRYFGEEIRQKVSININVFMRTQPLGAHIAVGPFSDRSKAEQWNNYLKNSGYGNARVYYGK